MVELGFNPTSAGPQRPCNSLLSFSYNRQGGSETVTPKVACSKSLVATGFEPRPAQVPNQGHQASPLSPDPQPQPALTHQTPGGGKRSTSTPTCPSSPPGRWLRCSRLSEPRPGARAGIKPGITPKARVSSFCPIVQPDTATRPSPQLSTLPLAPAPQPLLGSVPHPAPRAWGLLPRAQGPGAGWQDPRMLGPPPFSPKCPLPTLSRQGRQECAELWEMPSRPGRHQGLGCGQDPARTILLGRVQGTV